MRGLHAPIMRGGGTHTHTHTYTTHTLADVSMHIHRHMYIYTHTRTQSHTHMHTHIEGKVLAFISNYPVVISIAARGIVWLTKCLCFSTSLIPTNSQFAIVTPFHPIPSAL